MNRIPIGGRRAAMWACALVTAGGFAAAGAADRSVIDDMHGHYDAIVKVQSAIIRGDLQATREPARYLAEHPTPAALPAQWQPQVDAMRTAARAVLNAGDLMQAATATSLIGKACGDCHIANDVMIEFKSVEQPRDDLDRASHMQRHQWAADRMWEGIIGPSEPAWGTGIDILLEAPLTPQELQSQPDDGTRQMARRVHQLAANGMMATDATEKSEIYAEFLSNCAGCHQSLGQGPKR